MNDDIKRGFRWFGAFCTVVLAVSVLLFFVDDDEPEPEVVTVNPLDFHHHDFLVERLRDDVKKAKDEWLLSGFEMFQKERDEELDRAQHYVALADGEKDDKRQEQVYARLAKGHLDRWRMYQEVIDIFFEEMKSRVQSNGNTPV